MTHICVSKLAVIGSDNGLSPDRRQAIIWANAGLWLIGPLGTNFSEILIEILTFSFKKMHLKVLSAKRWPFCLGPNVLMWWASFLKSSVHINIWLAHVYHINLVEGLQLFSQFHWIKCRISYMRVIKQQGWGQFRNWNWNWLQFQFQNWNWNCKPWNWNWNWNCKMEMTAVEMELKIPFQFHHQFSLLFPYFFLLMAHIDVLRIADVFFKERICFIISYCKKISVIEL